MVRTGVAQNKLQGVTYGPCILSFFHSIILSFYHFITVQVCSIHYPLQCKE